jgi:hypothetical protein
MAAVDVGRIRDRQQRVAMLLDLGGNDMPIAGARGGIVGLQRQLANALQTVDDLAQGLFLEPELVACEDCVRLVLIEPRQRRVEMRDPCRRHGIVRRRIDAQPRGNLVLSFDDSPPRVVESR